MPRIYFRWHSSTLEFTHSLLPPALKLMNCRRAIIFTLQVECRSSTISYTVRLRCARINKIKAPKIRVPRATPTPIPAFPPVERPEDGWGVLVAGGIPVVELVAEVEVVVEDVV
jgi:hypothetical protein